MSRRPLALALAAIVGSAALLPLAASAEDLMQTYELARAGDPQFSAAESTRDATKEGAVQARAAMLPQIDGSASLTKSRSKGPATESQRDPVTGEFVLFSGEFDSDTTTRNVGVDVRQMVFDRSRFTTLRSQNALSRASDFTLEAAGDTLITRTSAAYFNVLIAIETLAAAEAQEAALKKQFDFASKRLEVGLAPITDVHEARAQYDAARANSILARNAVQDAYQALVEITGQPVANLKGLPDDFQPALPESRDVEGWVATALAENPSLKAQAADVEAAEHNVATARSGHYPTLGLRASYGKALPGLYGNPEFTGSNDASTSVGLSLSIPIFSGFATQSNVRSSLAQRDIARDQLEQQKRALERNTRNAYQALVAGISEVEARRLALVSAQSAYYASQVGLEVGTRTVLDVLNNQRTLFSAQQDYAQAKYNFLQNRLLLEQAAGTLQVSDLEDVNRLLTTDESVARAIGTQQ